MTRPWFTLGLLAGTLAVSLASAAPRTRAPAPASPTQTLTPQERFCRAAGEYAFNRAWDRDNGYAYTTILAYSRQWHLDHGTPELGAFHEQILLVVFSLPQITPAQARQWEELSCLKALAAEAPTSGTRTRY
jgi:hypothetical protein